ncbi:unnamed protein product [Soboliphyme baturini]|uniref:Uncharacterized protein n=1 Tax=Soboliphyme baturini TaxID=241478 RepID=A0A183J909_9BILA|nr:unnamed protein product [Soboliphyme baturini]
MRVLQRIHGLIRRSGMYLGKLQDNTQASLFPAGLCYDGVGCGGSTTRGCLIMNGHLDKLRLQICSQNGGTEPAEPSLAFSQTVEEVYQFCGFVNSPGSHGSDVPRRVSYHPATKLDVVGRNQPPVEDESIVCTDIAAVALIKGWLATVEFRPPNVYAGERTRNRGLVIVSAFIKNSLLTASASTTKVHGSPLDSVE